MKPHGMHIPLSFLMAALLLSGCTAAISQEMRRKVGKDVSFSQALGNPDAHRGQIVMWGGKILEIMHREGNTAIKVLQTPLDIYGMPMDEDYSEGRFVVTVAGHVDREIYKEGRMLTAAGEITGKEVDSWGALDYVCPVMQGKEVRLWENSAQSLRTHRPYWYRDEYGYPYSYQWPYYGHRFFFFR